MKELNYMRGQLLQMPKKQVVNICYNLCKATNKKVNKTNLNKFEKEHLIGLYTRIRNDYMLG